MVFYGSFEFNIWKVEKWNYLTKIDLLTLQPLISFRFLPYTFNIIVKESELFTLLKWYMCVSVNICFTKINRFKALDKVKYCCIYTLIIIHTNDVFRGVSHFDANKLFWCRIRSQVHSHSVLLNNVAMKDNWWSWQVGTEY